MFSAFLLAALTCALALSQSRPAITIDQAIQEALGNNLELAAARFGISIAEARQITARLRPNPVLTSSADHLDLLGTGYSSANNAGPNEYSLRTDWAFERGGKRASRIELAAAGISRAEFGLRDVIRRLVYDVQNAVLDIHLQKKTWRLLRITCEASMALSIATLLVYAPAT